MSQRNVIYEHYNSAKGALCKANAVCQHAEELSRETQSSLARATVLLSQITYLRSSIYDQLQVLRTITKQAIKDEERLKLDFTTTLKDLDARDDELNSVLNQLKATRLPDELVQTLPTSGQVHFSRTETKTLFDFAHEEAVETLKGQLRQLIDDMQENQENMTHFREEFTNQVLNLEKIWYGQPVVPVLTLPEHFEASDKGTKLKSYEAASLSKVAKAYMHMQEDHIGEMAKLLLSLTEHYDHSSKLFKSDNSLPLDEVEELRTIVDHDSQQLEDVLVELDERSVEMVEDVTRINAYVTDCTNANILLTNAFQIFEQLDADVWIATLSKIRNDRTAALGRLDHLREQLTGLSDQYTDFYYSFMALILEIDRRVKYEKTISSFLEQTQQTLAHLAEDELRKREHFIYNHGDSLPGDIWHGIRDPPTAHEVSFGENITQAPRLPLTLIEACQIKVSNDVRTPKL